jgi:hypothetical protein
VSRGPLAERLAELDLAVAAARERHSDAKGRARSRANTALGVEVARPLADYGDAVAFKKREADEEEHRRAQDEVLGEIRERGLLLRHVGRGLLQVTDPGLEDEIATARRAYLVAKRERETFAQENADGLRDEHEAAEMRRLRDAIAGDDPAAVREALGRRTAPVLTTADLPAPA